MSTHHRRSKGAPQGGEFAPRPHAEADVALPDAGGSAIDEATARRIKAERARLKAERQLALAVFDEIALRLRAQWPTGAVADIVVHRGSAQLEELRDADGTIVAGSLALVGDRIPDEMKKLREVIDCVADCVRPEAHVEGLVDLDREHEDSGTVDYRFRYA